HRDVLLFSSIYSFLAAIFALSLALGVIVAVGFLLYVQIKCVLANRTAIEEYICLKADSRRNPEDPFIYPYNLGWRRNWNEIMHAKGTGVWWPIRRECTQFTFSEEQLIQKQIKRHTARQLRVSQEFKGRWYAAWRYGPRVLFCQPCSEESRIPVRIGEVYAITRGNKHWVYGHRIYSPFDSPVDADSEHEDDVEETPLLSRPVRGWFPRACVLTRDLNATSDATTTSDREEPTTDERTAASVEEDEAVTEDSKKDQ
ncbi:palmitoyltransferase ZDHHC6-like protein, partial [Aphelenchoides avenae]